MITKTHAEQVKVQDYKSLTLRCVVAAWLTGNSIKRKILQMCIAKDD